MKVIMTLDSIISRAINVEGYGNLVAYDENHTSHYGYWMCKLCGIGFFPGGLPIHKTECSLEGERRKSYSIPDMIYVLGPNEKNNFFSPFEKEKIEKIKELAKAQFLIQKEEEKTKL